jgi:hypothetical protein
MHRPIHPRIMLYSSSSVPGSLGGWSDSKKSLSPFHDTTGTAISRAISITMSRLPMCTDRDIMHVSITGTPTMGSASTCRSSSRFLTVSSFLLPNALTRESVLIVFSHTIHPSVRVVYPCTMREKFSRTVWSITPSA